MKTIDQINQKENLIRFASQSEVGYTAFLKQMFHLDILLTGMNYQGSMNKVLRRCLKISIVVRF